MTRRLALLLCCCALTLTSCSRDPNVRKQKYFESGEHYFADGKYGEAAIQYRNAIKIDSHFAAAHYKLSQAYLRLRDVKDAYDELNTTVSLDPNNLHAHTDLANLLIASHNAQSLTEAKPHLDVLRAQQPNAPETHEAWANYNAAQNNLPAAIQEMQQAIALDPQRSESYLLLALFQYGANQPDAAESNFKKAVEADPKAIKAQVALGNFYQSRNRLADAEQQFHRAVDVDPKSPAPRLALARLLMAEGKSAEIEAFARQTKKDLPDNPQTYSMLGDYYYGAGNLDKALDEYASLDHDHPKDPTVRKNYIQLLILKNRLDEAAKLNDEVLKSNPRDSDALVNKGQIQLRRGDSAGAITSLQSAVQDDPDNAAAHYQLGIAFDQQHNEPRAESEWHEAVRLRPDMTDALHALAAVQKHLGESEALLQTAQQLINSQPASPDGYLLKTVAEIDLRKFSDAQDDAGEAQQRAPQSPAPYFQMGNIQLAQKHYGEAEKFYKQSIEKDPAFIEAMSGLLNTCYAQKQFEKAIAAASTQVAKSPNNSGLYDLLGTAYFNAHNFSAAQTALQKSLDLDKTNADALEKLGKAEAAQGSIDQALALYQDALKQNPSNVRLYVLSGEMYESKQDWENAQKMYQQALAMQPGHPLASNQLAYLLLEQGGNVDLALSMAQTARRGMSDSASAADTLGWAYYHKGVYPSAITQFQEALHLSEQHGEPDDPTIHYHLGLAYQKSNQLTQARQQFEKSLKLNPNNPDAKKALAEIHG